MRRGARWRRRWACKATGAKGPWGRGTRRSQAVESEYAGGIQPWNEPNVRTREGHQEHLPLSGGGEGRSTTHWHALHPEAGVRSGAEDHHRHDLRLNAWREGRPDCGRKGVCLWSTGSDYGFRRVPLAGRGRETGRDLGKVLQPSAEVHGRCGPPVTGVHILRHSAAKLRRDAGESVEAVSSFLDHSSLAVTTVYLRRLEGQQDAAWGKVAEALGV